MSTMPPHEPDIGEKVDNLTGSVDGLRDAVADERVARQENTAAQQEATRVLLEKQSKSDAALQATKRQGRKLAAVCVVGFVAVAVIVSWLWSDARRREAENVDRLVSACLSSNRAREQSQVRIEDAGSTLADSFARVIGAANAPKDPEAFAALFDKVKVDYVQHMRDNWSVDLRPRDCG